MMHHYYSVMIYGILTSSLTRAFQTSILHPPALRIATFSLRHNSGPATIVTSHHSILSSLAATTNNNDPSSSSILTQSRTKCFRPTVSDVDRISYGKPAKVKGTGSRGVPHRLNSDERETFDRSRKRGFLEVTGSSYRRERRGSPLLNTWRNWCDAKGKVCVVLHKGVAGGGGGGMMEDEVVVDLSPMRLPGEFGKIEEVVRKSVVEDLTIVAVVTVMEEEEEYAENDDGDEDDTIDEDDINDRLEDSKDEDDAWNDRPIHQLPPYSISWTVPNRSEAKSLCKHLATIFDTKDGKATSKSRKPMGVKPGKNRRSGGYGIG